MHDGANFEALKELRRLADLLRMIAETAKTIAKRGDQNTGEVEVLAAELTVLAEKFERL